MPRRACLAIGVSTVAPPRNQAMAFGYLDGAVIAARTIGEWARSSGFGDQNVRIVVDEDHERGSEPVTRERVQQAVDELFPAGAEDVSQLVLAFCGHGLTDAHFNSISWLFSDSQRNKYRVASEAFCKELQLHGVQRITLITDACREAPNSLDMIRWDVVRGIIVDGQEPRRPRLDRLAACQDGQLGYMVTDPGAPGSPGKCVFSGVVADVLWGMEPSAIENGVITASSLAACVSARTAERAREYQLRLDPDCPVAPEQIVLYDQAAPPQGPPRLQPWPPTSRAAAMGNRPRTEASEIDADRIFNRVRNDIGFRADMLGSDFGAGRHEFAMADGLPQLPRTSKHLLRHLVKLRNGETERPPGATRGALRRREQAIVRRLEAGAATSTRKRAATGVRRSLGQLERPQGAGGPNLVVADPAARLWSSEPADRFPRKTSSLRFRVGADEHGTPVLVRFGDSSFSPMVPYRGLFAMVTRSTLGEVFQVYGERQVQGDRPQRGDFDAAVAAIAAFARGRLAPSRVGELAARLRRGKHVDPVLGVICAYLYQAVADYDNIRRMAFYYAEQDQPVPFDIALLGDIPVTRDEGGRLQLRIPAVREQKRRAGEERLPDYAIHATPATEARIGGRCPWLGFGWDFVSLAGENGSALVEGLAPHAREISRTGFTLLPAGIGEELAGRWGLQPSEPV